MSETMTNQRVAQIRQEAEKESCDCIDERDRVNCVYQHRAELLAARDALAAQLTELRQLRERAESDADEAIRGQLAAVKRAEAAEAQLTEVTREFSAAQAHIAELSLEERDLRASLAPLRAVVEDLRSWLFEQFDMFKTRDNVTARAVAASFKDVIIKLDDLSALPADPSAPTPR